MKLTKRPLRNEPIYICIGEKVSNSRMGMCGGFGTANDFIKWLYGDKANGYFDGWTDKEMLGYMTKYSNKRFRKYDHDYGWSIKNEIKEDER